MHRDRCRRESRFEEHRLSSRKGSTQPAQGVGKAGTTRADRAPVRLPIGFPGRHKRDRRGLREAGRPLPVLDPAPSAKAANDAEAPRGRPHAARRSVFGGEPLLVALEGVLDCRTRADNGRWPHGRCSTATPNLEAGTFHRPRCFWFHLCGLGVSPYGSHPAFAIESVH